MLPTMAGSLLLAQGWPEASWADMAVVALSASNISPDCLLALKCIGHRSVNRESPDECYLCNTVYGWAGSALWQGHCWPWLHLPSHRQCQYRSEQPPRSFTRHYPLIISQSERLACPRAP